MSWGEERERGGIEEGGEKGKKKKRRKEKERKIGRNRYKFYV